MNIDTTWPIDYSDPTTTSTGVFKTTIPYYPILITYEAPVLIQPRKKGKKGKSLKNWE